jgi:hypothetical protein
MPSVAGARVRSGSGRWIGKIAVRPVRLAAVRKPRMQGQRNSVLGRRITGFNLPELSAGVKVGKNRQSSRSDGNGRAARCRIALFRRRCGKNRLELLHLSSSTENATRHVYGLLALWTAHRLARGSSRDRRCRSHGWPIPPTSHRCSRCSQRPTSAAMPNRSRGRGRSGRKRSRATALWSSCRMKIRRSCRPAC